MTDLRKLADEVLLRAQMLGYIPHGPDHTAAYDELVLKAGELYDALHQPTTSGVESTQANDPVTVGPGDEVVFQVPAAQVAFAIGHVRGVMSDGRILVECNLGTNESGVMELRAGDLRTTDDRPVSGFRESADAIHWKVLRERIAELERELTDLRNVRDAYLQVTDELKGVRKTMCEYADIAERLERELDDARLNMDLAFRERDEARAELEREVLAFTDRMSSMVRLDDETQERIVRAIMAIADPANHVAIRRVLRDLRDGKLGGGR